MELIDAQELLGRPRTIGVFYIRLKDPSLRDRFLARAERLWPDLLVSGSEDLDDQQSMAESLQGMVWGIGGLAIVIGGVGMMNSQLMSVMERTREIGVLRAVGWTKRRVLWMILMESIVVCLIGGLVGAAIGYAMIYSLSHSTTILGLNTENIRTQLLQQAFTVVLILGLVGAAQLDPYRFVELDEIAPREDLFPEKFPQQDYDAEQYYNCADHIEREAEDIDDIVERCHLHLPL